MSALLICLLLSQALSSTSAHVDVGQRRREAWLTRSQYYEALLRRQLATNEIFVLALDGGVADVPHMDGGQGEQTQIKVILTCFFSS